MTDITTPNLPARNFEATAAFYKKLGFEETWKDGGWMILKKDQMLLEFFLHPGLDPATSWFSCCFRLDDVESFFQLALRAGIPEAAEGWPRLHRPTSESWGGKVGALVDIDGTLIRMVQENRSVRHVVNDEPGTVIR
ncbi:bleomycin resistance protein [Xylophilus sp. Kf1]|nr:bleomycin resistance protein [Xylophilus sp. Kf1]